VGIFDGRIEAAKKLLISGKTPRDVAKILEVSVPTLYRWIPEAASISMADGT
jgi:transposase